MSSSPVTNGRAQGALGVACAQSRPARATPSWDLLPAGERRQEGACRTALCHSRPLLEPQPPLRACSGAVLTKMDGDSRGGAALSVKAVSGKPIKFVGTGEKLEALEPFYPDRIASRILGELLLLNRLPTTLVIQGTCGA